jgi:hypothetical protein
MFQNIICLIYLYDLFNLFDSFYLYDLFNLFDVHNDIKIYMKLICWPLDLSSRTRRRNMAFRGILSSLLVTYYYV